MRDTGLFNTTREEDCQGLSEACDGRSPGSPSSPLRQAVTEHRTSEDEGEEGILSFCRWSKGPPQILLLVFFYSMAAGCTSSVIPEVMSDRYARLLHGYDGATKCYELTEDNQACHDGSDDAQSSAALETTFSSVLQFTTAALVGSMSDQRGRRPFSIVAVVLSSLSPIVLVLMQLFPWIHPSVYYISSGSTGLVSIIVMSYATLSDSIPPSWRAPFNGILMSALYVGFAVSPSFALVLSHLQLSTLSAGVFVLAVLMIVCCLPETLPMVDRSEVADPNLVEPPTMDGPEMAVPLMSNEDGEQDTTRASDETCSSPETSSSPGKRCNVDRSCSYCLLTTLARPFREMAILGRDRYFQTLSVVAFCSALVLRADLTLMLYFLEDQLHFSEGDIAQLFLLDGTLSVVVQGCFLRPLVARLGEDRTLTLAFMAGTAKYGLYAMAADKRLIFMSVPLSSLTALSFPTIAAMKSNNASPQEQGRIQGALFSLTAIADALGPLLFQAVNHYARHSIVPGAMWIVAMVMEAVAAVFAFCLPAPPYQGSRSTEETNDGDRTEAVTWFEALPAENGADSSPLHRTENVLDNST